MHHRFETQLGDAPGGELEAAQCWRETHGQPEIYRNIHCKYADQRLIYASLHVWLMLQLCATRRILPLNAICSTIEKDLNSMLVDARQVSGYAGRVRSRNASQTLRISYKPSKAELSSTQTSSPTNGSNWSLEASQEIVGRWIMRGK